MALWLEKMEDHSCIVRPIREMNELSELPALQKRAWGCEDIDVIPSHLLKAVSDELGPTGLVLGCFLDGKIAGYVLAFPTTDPEEVLMHQVGVSPDNQQRGVGYRLMLELRRMLSAGKVKKIFWTYDPLESVNANLYIRKLGGIVTRHFADYYGETTSMLHFGLPTDRFRVEWNISDGRVEETIRLGHVPEMPKDRDAKRVDIPLGIQELKKRNPGQALEWRIKTRELFDEYVEKRKLTGVDFVCDRASQKGTYVFKKKNS